MDRIDNNNIIWCYYISWAGLLVHAIFSTKDRQPFLRSEEIREIFKRHQGSPSRNAMFGIETLKGRTPLQLQGASLDVTSPRAKAPGLFC